MMLIPLMLAGALAFGHGQAVDQRPYAAGRSNAIIEAARSRGPVAAEPEATSVRYPSADGDILAGMGQPMSASPMTPKKPVAAVFPPMSPPPSTDRYSTDSSGLLGGPKH